MIIAGITVIHSYTTSNYLYLLILYIEASRKSQFSTTPNSINAIFLSSRLVSELLTCDECICITLIFIIFRYIKSNKCKMKLIVYLYLHLNSSVSFAMLKIMYLQHQKEIYTYTGPYFQAINVEHTMTI